jgi:hypothetical protein
MNLDFLEDLCGELLQSDCDRSESLAALSDAELQDAYVDVLQQFGLELVIGVDEHSHWMSDSLLIYSNQGPIHACQTAFYAILCELDRRGGDRPDERMETL